MNILFFCRFFYPHIGGVEKHVLEISKILVKNNNVTIVAEQDNKKTKLQDEYRGINIYRIPISHSGWLKKFNIWYWIFKNIQLIQQADIIHCHDVFFWYLPFRFLFPHKKVFTTFHGYESYPIRKNAIAVRKLSELLSFGNLCIGTFIKKWYKTNPTYVSYGGVEAKKTFGKKLPDVSAVFIGRLDEQTGILDYVKTADIIQKKITDFRFTIVGDGKFKSKIINKYHVIGFKENAQKYFSSTRFAFVSRYLSIMEAMASRRLVFALYDNPLKKDYLSMTPFSKYIIIVKSEKILADKVLYYISHPVKERELVEKAFTYVKDQTWNKVVDMYLKLWRS